jgi:hypothetical protein
MSCGGGDRLDVEGLDLAEGAGRVMVLGGATHLSDAGIGFEAPRKIGVNQAAALVWQCSLSRP